jgi:type I restriction enzyme M protein
MSRGAQDYAHVVREIDAVQVFSCRLIEEFEYPKEFITTRPQFYARQRPFSDRSRG